MSELLVAGGIYGLSGALYKIVGTTETIARKYTNANEHKGKSNIHLDLTNLLVDMFSFSLIGTGFVFAILGEAFGVEFVNLPVLYLLFGFHNIFLWFYGFSLGFIDEKGYSRINRHRKHPLFADIFEIILIILPVYLAPALIMMIVSLLAKTNTAYFSSLLIFLIPALIDVYVLNSIFKIRKTVQKQQPNNTES